MTNFSKIAIIIFDYVEWSAAICCVGILKEKKEYEELMENISQQIKVKKTKEGSRITIEFGL